MLKANAEQSRNTAKAGAPMLKFDTMNEAQRQAVMHGEGPLLVLAGPGSGKTFTITQRILYLLEVQKEPPEKILVITFTKEAALSMQRRFQEQCKDGQVIPVNFGTFHSVFFQILKQSKVSCTGKFWQEHQKSNLMKTILKEYRSEEERLFLAAISFYKNTNDRQKAEKILPEDQRKFFEPVWERYETERKRQGAMDFDDMVYECARLLENDREAGKYWSGRFSHILMDEFQDINPMQYKVIKLLSDKPYNLFAVGDDDQSIYGFRGSKPACMKQFEQEFRAKKVLLNINYRSMPDIVKVSSKVIAGNKERFEKKPVPFHKQSEASSVFIQKFVEQEEQYAYLMDRLKHTNDGSTQAVLFRTNTHMQLFAAVLRKQGISFEMKEKTGDMQEHFIFKDISAYLHLALGEEERRWYLQILNKPQRFLSTEVLYYPGEWNDRLSSKSLLAQMKEYYRERQDINAGRAMQELLRLEKQLKYLKQTSAYLAVQYICRVMGYEEYLKECGRKGKQNADRLEEWFSVLDYLKEDAKEYRNIKEWVKALETKYDKVQRNRNQMNEKLHLMTVHASKGLEFDHVYIPGCNEKTFPYGSMPDGETCEEERRIFYVAMTRAKKSLELLYLSGTKERPRLPSRFLNPILINYSSSTSSSNSQLSRYSSKASATFSYSSSSSIQRNSGSSLGSSGFSL